MNSNKLLSVIIVSYNAEKFIETAISSALKYIPKNSEVIVIDNASTDGTLEEIEKFKSEIRIIKSNQNLGFSKANNLAAKQAWGEFLFFFKS